LTERLYYTDSYLGEFEAAIVDLTDDGRRVYLDRTGFYAAGVLKGLLAAVGGRGVAPRL
jgi:Ser-tRNA(Ala) deacylase AlaX